MEKDKRLMKASWWDRLTEGKLGLVLMLMFKLQHNCTLSHSSKVILKILQVRAPTVHELWTSRYSSWISKRQRNQRSNCQHPLDHWKSERVREKHLLLLYWLCQSLWLCESQQTGKFFKKWAYQTTWPAPERYICRLRSNSENWTWNNRLVPNQERSMPRLYIVTLII